MVYKKYIEKNKINWNGETSMITLVFFYLIHKNKKNYYIKWNLIFNN